MMLLNIRRVKTHSPIRHAKPFIILQKPIQHKLRAHSNHAQRNLSALRALLAVRAPSRLLSIENAIIMICKYLMPNISILTHFRSASYQQQRKFLSIYRAIADIAVLNHQQPQVSRAAFPSPCSNFHLMCSLVLEK